MKDIEFEIPVKVCLIFAFTSAVQEQ